jgi:hypothetical protein
LADGTMRNNSVYNVGNANVSHFCRKVTR